MVRRLLVALSILGALASPALGQSPRVEVSANAGWTFSDGVIGDAVRGGDGGVYNRIDPGNGASFHVTLGFLTTDNVEVGFLFGRQLSELEVSGIATQTIDKMAVDHYHGYFAYNFGPADAPARPYAMVGLGATRYGSVGFAAAAGETREIPGRTKLSTTWGAGVKAAVGDNLGVKVGVRWTPTLISSDADGWWCDPWWGCYVAGDRQSSNQFEFTGGVAFRFD